MRILVIDDNTDNVDSMARLLRYDGYEVSAAYCGSVALELAEADPPDAVLSDISMPGMDGYEVARQLRRMFHGRLLLVAVTALSLEEDRKRSREAGFDRHLVKPVDVEEVRKLLAAARVALLLRQPVPDKTDQSSAL